MKTYLVIEHQAGEGCDYTIGCGIRTSKIEANDLEHAIGVFLAEKMEDYMEDGVPYANPLRGDEALANVEFYELGLAAELNEDQLEEIALQIDAQIEAGKQSENEQNERKLAEELLKKYPDLANR